MGTQILQWDPRETEDTAAAFMAMVHRIVIVAGRDQDYIRNMVQSPIPFTSNKQRTLKLEGAGTVHICKSTCDTNNNRIGQDVISCLII